jgi:hypothetical protein
MRVADGKIEKVAVELGMRDDVAGQVGLRSGVNDGDVVVLGSARAALAEGTPVKVAERADGARAQQN